MKLLTIENAKTSKGEALGYLTGILYLAPHRIADKQIDLCPGSTPGCRAACLYSAGRGVFKNTQDARIIKTLHFLNNPQGFIEQLDLDIQALKRKAKKQGLKAAVRLNGTSDIAWHHIALLLFEKHNDIQFYDYTKVYSRMLENLPKNYHLTYSVSEVTSNDKLEYLKSQGKTIAVVTTKQYNGHNGDEHDLRFLNGPGIVSLKPKGKAKRDVTGFVFNGGVE